MDMTVESGSWHNWQLFYVAISLLGLKRTTSIILGTSFESSFIVLRIPLNYNLKMVSSHE